MASELRLSVEEIRKIAQSHVDMADGRDTMTGVVIMGIREALAAQLDCIIKELRADSDLAGQCGDLAGALATARAATRFELGD